MGIPDHHDSALLEIDSHEAVIAGAEEVTGSRGASEQMWTGTWAFSKIDRVPSSADQRNRRPSVTSTQ